MKKNGSLYLYSVLVFVVWERGSERDICLRGAGRVSCLWEPHLCGSEGRACDTVSKETSANGRGWEKAGMAPGSCS